MKEKKVFTVTDLGGGDGGKGGVVHKICSIKNAHTVVKVGGAQGSHGVRTAKGLSFNFSQFGCGTFEGTKTHISNLMVIEPYRFLNEGKLLRLEHGIGNVFDYVTVDENAICVTPFHTIASRLNELARKDKAKGTVGVGVGVAVSDAETHPGLIIRAGDIGNPCLKIKLELIREQKIQDLSEIIKNVSDLWPEDQQFAKEQIELLNDVDFTDRIVGHFNLMSSLVKIVDTDYLRKKILSEDGTVVFESSHGVLTDRYNGFHPYTTKLRTLPSGSLDLLKSCGYDGEIIKLGVTRAYQIRHGAGPMVTESPDLLGKLLPGSSKDENRWQGKVRVGALDFVSLRYAINVCGGPDAFDGLAITWFDQILKNNKWNVCDKYIGVDDQNFFTPEGEIKVRYGQDQNQIKYQEQLSKKLFSAVPDITSHEILQGQNQESSIDFCKNLFKDKLGVPVKMISFGPTEEDKVSL
ncbi:MAG: adenylosuccinate synthetase [Minisyncoccia bacterium]